MVESILDPEGCGAVTSLTSDRGVVTVDAPLLDFISFRIAPNILFISTLILSILSGIFRSTICVQTCISPLNWLGSLNWFSKLDSRKLFWEHSNSI